MRVAVDLDAQRLFQHRHHLGQAGMQQLGGAHLRIRRPDIAADHGERRIEAAGMCLSAHIGIAGNLHDAEAALTHVEVDDHHHVCVPRILVAAHNEEVDRIGIAGKDGRFRLGRRRQRHRFALVVRLGRHRRRRFHGRSRLNAERHVGIQRRTVRCQECGTAGNRREHCHGQDNQHDLPRR